MKKNCNVQPKSMFSFSSFSACLKDEISKEIFLQAATANCPFMSFGLEIFGQCFKNLQLSLRIFRNYFAEKNVFRLEWDVQHDFLFSHSPGHSVTGKSEKPTDH